MMARIYSSLEELIGRTPLLRLERIEKKLSLGAKLYAKLEFFNPAGSIKDRAAKQMLDDAEREGKLLPNSTVIEATSGNTGIGLASVAAQRGYRTVIVMPENMSEERKALMRAYGAEVVLTDAALGMAGAIDKANELLRECENSFCPDQFANPANAEAHRLTTGPEIYEDTDGEVDIFVAGVGTGGTLTGCAEYLKGKKKCIKIVAVEPKSSPVLSGGEKGAHGLQGIGAGFIPEVLKPELIDEVITVTEGEAYTSARLMAGTEGALVGISSGAALTAAIALAKNPENTGKNIVVILPDTGERYLSSGLF